MELWTALLLGMAGSLHCAGMCGPLVIALPAPGGRGVPLVLGRVLYNLGRVITYCLLGVVFGLVGRSLALAGLQRWVSLGLGLAIVAGLLFSRSHRWKARLARPVDRLKHALGYWLRQRSFSALLVFGLLNGLLPCGLVYVACAGAVATGGVVSAIEYMLVFGAGTVPMMLGLGLAGHCLHASLRLKFQKLVPLCLIALAALLILRGLSLGIPYLSPNLSGGGHAAPACH
jgi:uncharacterized protein